MLLASQGLIDYERNRGATMRTLHCADVVDLCTIRRTLETQEMLSLNLMCEYSKRIIATRRSRDCSANWIKIFETVTEHTWLNIY